MAERIQTHMFHEPIELRLEKYRMEHRVLGVERRRNPNGIGTKKHVYAIAEWRLLPQHKWRMECNYVSMMRLANLVEHPFPRNQEKYANEW